MKSEDPDPKQPFVTRVIYRFLGGAALGAFVVFIPISYGSLANLNLAQASVASGLIVLFGLLSSIWGDKFIDIVARMLNGTGL
jgi:hypothetical protein